VDYSSTKGAIVTFTRSLAVQLAPKGIRVNGLAPGTIMTALQVASRPADEIEELGVGEVPLHNRAGQPAEMGPGYVFLASSDSNAVTGQVLHMNSTSFFLPTCLLSVSCVHLLFKLFLFGSRMLNKVFSVGQHIGGS
jgi:NAD(P)-dependent dehydrogenase (short-subunit alcohol dehydrogenase family)